MQREGLSLFSPTFLVVSVAPQWVFAVGPGESPGPERRGRERRVPAPGETPGSPRTPLLGSLQTAAELTVALTCPLEELCV